ncbi:MAG: DinB family protein [Cytophagales bacterium]|jgi:hypothetical protein|nr:DinB family protein [Cytophagales bacterium]
MDNQLITNALVSQYKSGLTMLRQVIEKMPDSQWNDAEYNNPNWQLSYHILWAVKFYLGANAEAYVPWKNAIEGAESLGGTQEWENPDENVVVEGYHSKEEILSFIDSIENDLKPSVEALPLDKDSGFEWYPYTRLELHINTIRHSQHHTAQLIERLKRKGITGFTWAIDGNPPQEW